MSTVLLKSIKNRSIKNLLPILILIIFSTDIGANSLSRFLLEKYSFLQLNLYNNYTKVSQTEIKISGDAYIGEFPLLLSYEPKDYGVTLFTGFPRFIPLYLGLGRYTEVGYIDMYNTYTPIRSIGVGTKLYLSPFKQTPYIFLSSKIGRFDIGGSLYLNKDFELAMGIFPDNFSISLYMRNLSDIYTSFSINLKDRISINVRGGISDNKPFVSMGFGIFYTDPSDNDYAFDSNKFLMGAHRGSLQKFPENSYMAFKYAMSKSYYDFIEFDVYRTKDNRYVIIHDPILIRYTGELRNVRNLTLKELRERNMSNIPFRRYNTKIMTLEDVAREMKNSKKKIVIEIKDIGNKENNIKEFIATVDKVFGNNAYKRITYLCLSPKIVRYLKQNSKNRVALSFFPITLSNYLPFLFKWEIENSLKATNTDIIFFYTNILDKREYIDKLSKELGFEYAYWNFHDIIYERKSP